MMARKRISGPRKTRGRPCSGNCPGQRVEVMVVADEEQQAADADELRRLLAETQVLPTGHTVTDEQIAEDVAAYRAEPSTSRVNGKGALAAGKS